MPGRTGERTRTARPSASAAKKKSPPPTSKAAKIQSAMTGHAAVREAREAVLTAAAVVYDADSKPMAPLTGGLDVAMVWQTAVLGYVKAVPELGAGTAFMGNACSMVGLELGRRNRDGTVDDAYKEVAGTEGKERVLVQGIDPKVAEYAEEAIASLRAEIGGQAELLRGFGEKLFLIGEGYLVPKDSPGGLTFEVLSRWEVRQENGKWFRVLGPGVGASSTEELPSPPIRIYRPDPQWSSQPTSSIRSCLEVLEELVILTRLVRGGALSRMSLSGIFVLADEADEPLDPTDSGDGDGAEQTNPLAVDIIQQGIKAIDDPASPAAFMPYLLQIPFEYIDKGAKFIEFSKDDSMVVRRDEAVARLARGIDLPYEVIVGHQSCVDTETEILTARGWLRYDEVVEGDEILTLSHGSRRATKQGKPTADDRDADGSGLAEWQRVERVSIFDVVDHPMLSLEGRSHSSLSTLNHWWPMLSGRGKQNWVQSADIKTHHQIVPAAALADLPTEQKWSDDFVALVAWFWTEGAFHRAGQGGYIAQSERANPDHVASIRAALHRLVGPPSTSLHAASRGERVRAWRETPKPQGMVHFALSQRLVDDLRAVISYPEKIVDRDFLRSLTPAQLNLFIDVSIAGDGWQHPDRAATAQLHQVSRARAEAFGFACHLAGRAVTYRTTTEHGSTFGDSVRHHVLTRPSKPMRVGFTMQQREVAYTGKVWCPTVANGTWLARRNGSVYFTGNTTFANAAQISLDTYRIHIQPPLTTFVDAATAAVVWPYVAKRMGVADDQIKASGYPPEILQVGIRLNPDRLTSKPDRTKDVIEAYGKDQSQTAIANSELRDVLGLDPNGGPSAEETARRVEQIQLVKEKITVGAPTPEPGAVEPMASERLLGLVYQIAGAAEQTVERSIEKVGTKLRQRATRGTEAEMILGRETHEIARVLGPERTQRLLDGDPVAAEIRAFTGLVRRWAAEARHPEPDTIAETFNAFLTGVIQKRLFGIGPEVSPEICRPLVLGVPVIA